jgi:hypothetical protein
MMKRPLRKLTRASCFFLLVLAVLALAVQAEAGQTEKAELTGFSGDVEVFLNGAEDYVSAQEGMELSTSDKIKTASGASAELSFNQDNSNLVRLSESTVAEITFTGDEKMALTEGEALASISSLPSGSAFEIRTPTAVSGARGTDWVTKVTEEGTEVEALESQPYVRHFEASGRVSAQPTFITQGQMTTVKSFQKPMGFRPIPENRRQQWQLVKQDVRKRAGQALQKRQQRQPFNRNEFMHKIREQRNPSGFKPLQSQIKIQGQEEPSQLPQKAKVRNPVRFPFRNTGGSGVRSQPVDIREK